MLHRSAEELREYDSHNEKSKKRRQYAPKHTEIGTLILFLEIALDELGEKEAVLPKLIYH